MLAALGVLSLLLAMMFGFGILEPQAESLSDPIAQQAEVNRRQSETMKNVFSPRAIASLGLIILASGLLFSAIGLWLYQYVNEEPPAAPEVFDFEILEDRQR